MILGLQPCPKCGKAPKVGAGPMFPGDSKATYITTCETANCCRAFGVSEEEAQRAWNRLRGPRMTLPGDELGAGVHDAAARQQILGRLKTTWHTTAGLAGGFPLKRIEKHLRELVESGDAEYRGQKIPGTNVVRDLWRLAPVIECPACSRAGGADRGVFHAPPICPDDSTPPAAVAAGEPESPRNGVPDMAAKKQIPLPDQIPLIEVDHPATKKFKELRGQAQRLDAKAKKLNKEKKEARHAILELVREAFKVKPDVDGVIKFVLDGETVKITPGESKLSFTTEPLETDDEDEAEEAK
jgi:hypothetical protein